ncbi:MAG: S9 family peptidase [Candidatus Bipolaricaulia bacterium]
MNPVRIEDLLSYRFLSAVEIAPDGRHAAFAVKRANVEENEYSSDIHVVDLASLASRRLSASGKDGVFVWGSNSSDLYFTSKRVEVEDMSVLFRIRIDGGEAEQLATLPHKVEALVRCDNEIVLFTARVPLDEPSPNADDAKDYEVLEEIPFWMNGKGFTSRRRVHLFRFDLAGGTTTDLSEPNVEVEVIDVRGDAAIVSGRRFEGMAPTFHELWRIGLSTGDRRCIAIGDYRLDGVCWLDDGACVVVASDTKAFGLGENREVYTVEVESGTMTSLTPGWDKSVGTSIAADCRHGGGPVLRVDEDRVYVTVTERTHSELVRLRAGTDPEIAVVSPGSIDSYAVSGDTILAIELRPETLQELYAYRGGEEKQVTSLNGESLAGRNVSKPEPFWVLSSDGTEIDAWVIRPPDFDPAASYPAVLTIHGGPRAAYSDVFFHQMQTMAGRGYVILISNPHGGSGRGNAFADIRGKYGTVDYEDLMAVLDTGIERFSFIDRERLGVMGGSYGGFMTNWIIGHTDRFKAAVSQRSIANWIHKFCTTDIGYYFNKDQMLATPWEEGGSEKMWWHSPLRYADQAKTPTLFIHSEQDYRCWLPEGIAMFTALRYHGVESRLVMFREENHELSRSGKPKHRIRRLEEILAWFDKHLKAESQHS